MPTELTKFYDDVEFALGRKLNHTERDVARGFWDIGYNPQLAAECFLPVTEAE